jgi:monoamine oxidase
MATALAPACGGSQPAPPSPLATPRPVPARTRGATPSVAVIGGGLSGLAAGLQLRSAGVKVTVLEAQGRPGGRILTVRDPLRDGMMVEAGAKHVVGDPDLLALAASVGVKVAPRPPRPSGPALAEVEHLGGSRTVLPPGKERVEPTNLTREELALSFGDRLRRYLPAVVGFDPLTPDLTTPSSIELDRLTAADYLIQQGASPGLIADLDDSFGVGDGVRAMSALSLVRDVANMLREMQLKGGGRFAGGADSLPRALGAALGDDLWLHADVRRLAPVRGGIEVAFARHGRMDTMRADRVLLAVPPTVLDPIETTGVLSPEKRAALEAVGSTSVTRVWLQAATRFWVERGEQGTADTDLLVGRVRDESEDHPGPSGVIGLYLSGAKARTLGEMEDTMRIARSVEEVEKVHPGMKARLVAATSIAWDQDPFARGAYAFFRPGQLTRDRASLWAPEGLVHFAGDYSSSRPGFMHGALASARRAVTEIVTAMSASVGARG